VDVLTAAILRTVQPAERDETGKAVLSEGRWDAAAGRVRDRTQKGADDLESALEKERKRDENLDDLFEKARRKLRRPPED
jgi:hypothetical protein